MSGKKSIVSEEHHVVLNVRDLSRRVCVVIVKHVVHETSHNYQTTVGCKRAALANTSALLVAG